jgi:Family of unknown function (DUF6516)
MPFRDYVTALQTLLATTPFVTATALSYEERPPTAGLIKGWLVFADGSQLDFKEFLLTRPTLQVIKYGYHYRAGQRLLFRYDNANDPAARHLPTFPHHKHPYGAASGGTPLVAPGAPRDCVATDVAIRPPSSVSGLGA